MYGKQNEKSNKPSTLVLKCSAMW